MPNAECRILPNIAIMRAFVRLREILATHKDLARKLEEHERKLGKHDERFQAAILGALGGETLTLAPRSSRLKNDRRERRSCLYSSVCICAIRGQL